ncbi:MAG: transposase [Ketobacter sp.]|nr:transposase [Ketobacter sp.]
MEPVSNNTLPEHTQVKRRRRHSPAFRARVVAACAEPGVSIAAVARHYQLNANLIHKWRKAIVAGCNPTLEPPGFLALPLPANVTDSDQQVTLSIGELTIQWPLSHINQVVLWLKALQS